MKKYDVECGKKIAQLIRLLCKEKEITVQELEEKCGLGNGSVSRWEKGSVPRVSALIPVCNYLNISLDYLTSRTSNKDTFEEWTFKYNSQRLADEARLYETMGKLKVLFREVGMIDLNDKEIELINQYLKVLKQQ